MLKSFCFNIYIDCLAVNLKKYSSLLLVFFTFFVNSVYGQFSEYLQKKTQSNAVAAASTCSINTANCDPVSSAFIMNTSLNKEFYFDSFGKYAGGITLNGSTILKLKVAANTPTVSGPCQWKLVMRVSNGGAPVPASRWETMTSYGGGQSSTDIPTLDLLQIRVNNGCNTPKSSGIWQQFIPSNGEEIEIINPDSLVNAGASGTCSGGETNGVGSYAGSDYNEFSFSIDYRIVPGYVLDPGRYELSIYFCLTEK